MAETTWTPTDLAQTPKKGVPEGLWMQCPACEETLFKKAVESNLWVCPKCQHHMRVSARTRVDQMLDPGTFEPFDDGLVAVDPLKFVDQRPYGQRISDAQRKTGEKDALLSGFGFVKGRRVVVAVMDFTFLGGSMGSVVGERFVRGAQTALEQKVPFICITATGGARMQEGLLSLMQMAKTTAILTKLSEKKLPFISVLTDPTMGGVSASFAFMGDVVIAEPKALIGFAGPRVIENTVREKLPEGFQRSEFILQKGAIDMIVDRRKMREEIAQLLALLQNQPAEVLA